MEETRGMRCARAGGRGVGRRRIAGILRFGWVALALLAWAPIEGAEPRERVLCDVEDPANDCPGPDCACVDDRLEVTFDGTSSVLELDRYTEGASIEAVVVMDVVSTPMQGWQYGIAHDVDALTVASVTMEDTDAATVIAESSHFELLDWETVQTCLTEDCSPDVAEDRVDGGGWVSAVVTDFMGVVYLPEGRRSLARATYTLERNVGPAGTILEVTDLLARRGAPRIKNNMIVDEESRVWRTVIDGWIRIRGGDSGELRRAYCDLEDPWLDCNPVRCGCVEDTLEVTFDGDSDSILEYETFEDGATIEAVVVMDAVSPVIQGWQYGVAHDVDALTVTSATTAGTTAGDLLAGGGGFDATRSDAQTCLTPECSKEEEDGERIDGGGWISAVVVNFMGLAVLPVGRSSVARAHYTLQRDVGADGTVLEVTTRLGLKGSPRIHASVTIDGKQRVWNSVVDGWIRRSSGDEVPFRRGDVGVSRPGDEHPADGLVNIGDAVRILYQLFWNVEGLELECEKAADVDDDGEVTINDPVVLLNFLFMGGPRPPEPFEAPGLDASPDDLTCERYPS
jgi:hypothetical protein